MKTSKIDEIMSENICVLCCDDGTDECKGMYNCDNIIEFKQSLSKVLCEDIEQEKKKLVMEQKFKRWADLVCGLHKAQSIIKTLFGQEE